MSVNGFSRNSRNSHIDFHEIRTKGLVADARLQKGKQAKVRTLSPYRAFSLLRGGHLIRGESREEERWKQYAKQSLSQSKIARFERAWCLFCLHFSSFIFPQNN
jgi:hypothetical protein